MSERRRLHATGGRVSAPLASRRAAPTEHALVALQRAAGNRAVVLAVQRSGPRARPFTPADGVIHAPSSGIRAVLGDTVFAAGSPPELTVRTTPTESGGFTAVPQLGAPGPANIRAQYPAPGLYPVGRSGSGTVYGIISGDVSNLVRAGEQEHSDDAALAQQRVYDAVADAVRRRASTPTPGATAEQAEERCRAELCRSLPDRLKWKSEAPGPVWRGAVAALMAATMQRDDEAHRLGHRAARYEESVRHYPRLEQGDGLVVIEPGSSSIGEPSSEDLIDAAYRDRIDRGPGDSPRI